jgi:hypothetical protein
MAAREFIPLPRKPSDSTECQSHTSYQQKLSLSSMSAPQLSLVAHSIFIAADFLHDTNLHVCVGELGIDRGWRMEVKVSRTTADRWTIAETRMSR